MYRKNPRDDIERISQVLAGVRFPAEKWRLIIEAEAYGADASTRADLWGLPGTTYRDLTAVLAALGLDGSSPQHTQRYRVQAVQHVPGRVRPLR